MMGEYVKAYVFTQVINVKHTFSPTALAGQLSLLSLIIIIFILQKHWRAQHSSDDDIK
jgi:hypothetical protein